MYYTRNRRIVAKFIVIGNFWDGGEDRGCRMVLTVDKVRRSK
jgi:hypothetical protein